MKTQCLAIFGTAILSIVLSFISASTAYSTTQEFKTTQKITLREKTGRRKPKLKVVTELPRGSVISFDQDNLTDSMDYIDDDGDTRHSNSGWIYGVKIISAKGKSSRRIRRWNRKKLYLSELELHDLDSTSDNYDDNDDEYEDERPTRSRNQRMTEIKTQVDVTLMEKEGRNLERVILIPSGSVLKVNKNNNQGRMRYRTSGGSVKKSRRSWYKGVSIKKFNGSLSRSKMRRINKKSLYVSEDVFQASEPDWEEPDRRRDNRRDRRNKRRRGRDRDDSFPRGSMATRCKKKFISKGVPKEPLNVALRGYERYKRRFSVKDWLAIADYRKNLKIANSRKKRFYLLNLKTCEVHKEYVSHGSGKQDGKHRGDPDHDGDLDKCRHKGRTLNMTRSGFQVMRGWHQSKKKWTYLKKSANAKGIKLHGLQSHNEEVLRRGVVVHESGSVKNRSRKQGRSFGCIMFPKGRLKRLVNSVTSGKLKDGTLVLQYAPQCE